MGVVKFLTGTTLTVGAAAYAAYGWFHAHSEYAVLAAPRQVITAPVNGLLTHSLSFDVSVLDPGSTLATLAPDLRVDQELRRIATELSALQAEAGSLDALLNNDTEFAHSAEARTSALEHQRRTQLAESRKRAESAYRLRESEVDSARDLLERAEPLCASGLKSELECQDLRSRSHISARQLEVAATDVNLASFALTASRQGVDLEQQGSSQLVYREQLGSQLELRIADLRREVQLRQARIASLETTMRGAPVTILAPDRVVLWSVLKPSNTLVARGEPIVEVANCADRFIYAELAPGVYDDVSPGDPAYVQIHGQTIEGKVVRLLGPLTSVEQSADMLPLPPRRLLEGAAEDNGTVIIESDSIPADLSAGCGLGTQAYVSFDSPTWWKIW